MLRYLYNLLPTGVAIPGHQLIVSLPHHVSAFGPRILHPRIIKKRTAIVKQNVII